MIKAYAYLEASSLSSTIKLSISKDVIIETIEEYLKSNDYTYVAISIQLLDINNILEFEDYIFNMKI